MRPVPARYPISLSYGKPGKYAAGFHTGTDFECPVGTPVVAPHDCEIVFLKANDKSYGNFLILEGTGGKRVWLLAHLSRFVTTEIGHRFKSGQIVAYSGNTGNTTGPHLHAEERHAPFGYRDSQVPTAWRDAGAISHG